MEYINSNTIHSLGLVLGGVALFIYGIDQMSDGLKSIAGYRIRDYIEKYTSNLLMAVLVGTVISGVLHSSTAVTVISISLVRAGLMKLEQAIGITIGANIGTCFTSIMIGLNIEQMAYYIVFVGIVLMMLTKKKTISYIGKILLGFGLLFIGLQIMGDQLVLIADQPWFEDIMVLLAEQPWLALLGGTVATAVMQSSTAVIGIVQKLYTTGVIAPAAGAAFIFGSNVGTTLTAIVAGAGGSVSTKRASWFHAVYNIGGALIGMLVLVPFIKLTDVVNQMLNGNSEMWIAQAHFIFNIASTILILPFVKQSVALLKLVVPGEERQGVKVENIDDLDYTLIENFPAASLEIAKKNTLRMGRNVCENIKVSHTYLVSKEGEEFDEVEEIEALVNKYDTNLSKYLLKIAQQQTLAKDQTTQHTKNFLIVKYLERMSDLTVNLVEFYKMVYDERGKFSSEAIRDLEESYTSIEEILPIALHIYETENEDNSLLIINEKVDYLKQFLSKCRDRHFIRMRDDICTNEIAALNFVDILSNFDRIADHILHVANNSISMNMEHKEKALGVSRRIIGTIKKKSSK